MTLTILNVIYVLLAVAMIGFILVQRGAGAQAGSGFGGGASATVFGARGAGNFLTKSTAVLATVFFLLSLGMGMFVTRLNPSTTSTLGVMDEAPAAAPAAETPSATEVPAAPAPAAGTVPATGDVPVAPVDAAAPAAVPAAPVTAPDSAAAEKAAIESDKPTPEPAEQATPDAPKQ